MKRLNVFIIVVVSIVSILIISYFSTNSVIVEHPITGKYFHNNNNNGLSSEIVILNDSVYIHSYEQNKKISSDTGVFRFTFKNEFVQNLALFNFNFIYKDDRIERGRKKEIQFLYYVPSNRTAIISMYIESKSLDFIREVE